MSNKNSSCLGPGVSTSRSIFRRGSLTKVAASLALAAGAIFALPNTAHAADISGVRGVPRFDLHADLGWHRAYGMGGRIEFPIVPEGLLRRADDDLSLSLGAEVFFSESGYALGVWPLGALQWNFYLSPRWSIFPELGAVVFAGEDRYHDWVPMPTVAPFLGFGARFHFSPRVALLARVNWPAGFQLGLAF